MTLRWQCLDIDSADPRRAADFWQEALGWRRTHESDQEVVLEPPEGSHGRLRDAQRLATATGP